MILRNFINMKKVVIVLLLITLLVVCYKNIPETSSKVTALRQKQATTKQHFQQKPAATQLAAPRPGLPLPDGDAAAEAPGALEEPDLGMVRNVPRKLMPKSASEKKYSNFTRPLSLQAKKHIAGTYQAEKRRREYQPSRVFWIVTDSDPASLKTVIKDIRTMIKLVPEMRNSSYTWLPRLYIR